MKIGDVVAIKPDGWTWGLQEQVSQDWRIIRVPNMTQVQADAMLSAELGDPLLNPRLRKRGNYFDINELPGAMQAILFAPRTEVITATLNNNVQQISSFIKVKLALPPL